jgi:small subunit ribosomal protein S6
MQEYETIFILQPELGDEDVESTVKGFEQILTAESAELVKSERWGKKRLAYRVQKFWEGHYVFFEYKAAPQALAELERRLRIHEHVIKWLSVRKDPRAEAEEERRAARLAKAQLRPAARPSQDDREMEENLS